MNKRKKDKQQSTKHYTGNKKSSNTKKVKIEQHEKSKDRATRSPL